MVLLSSAGGRNPLFALAASAGAMLIFIFAFLAWQSPSKIPFTRPNPPHMSETPIHAEKAPTSINDIIRTLYAPLKAEPTEPFIREPNGSHIELPPNPRYKKPLGSEILILDLETRPLQSTDDFQRGEYEWRNINHVSGGIFNHYTYALIHGYDYKFIHASNFEDRHATWIKPSALANHIKNYKYIIFLDADAAFRFLHVPIEWMLNYWEIKKSDAITMAKDPWDPKSPQYNSDRFNRTYTNTGFMIVQNTPQTLPILKAWHECPDDVRYANCSQWKTPRFHEQSAFGEYIRYDYEPYIKELDCGQANGFPGVEVSNCQGKLIRHYWFEKHLVKDDFQQNMMNAITMPIQKLFAENIGHIITKTEENVIH